MTVRYPWPPPALSTWFDRVDAMAGDEWLIRDMIPADAVVCLSGPPKRGYKTWFAFNVVHALTTGRSIAELHPSRPEGINVLILALEGPAKPLRRRFSWLANANGSTIPEARVWIAHRYPFIFESVEWQARVAEFVHKNDIKLVVVDTLAKGMRGDENSTQDVGTVMRAADAIRSASEGTSLLYLHHLRKAGQNRGQSEDIDDDLRGSGSLSGAYDAHIAMRAAPGGKGLKMTVRTSLEAEKYYTVQWDIQGEREVAALHMEEFRPDAPVPTGFALDALEKLDEGRVYTHKQLQELWAMIPELVNKVCLVLAQNNALVRTAKGWKRVQ